MKLKPLLYILVMSLSGINSLYAVDNKCKDQLASFKNLYIELQKSLNYEGKDAYLDKKGMVALKEHESKKEYGDEYEGKVFEAALYKEYSLALKKVGFIYQKVNEKVKSAKTEAEKPDLALIAFVKAVDGNDTELATFIKEKKIDQVIDQLAEKGKGLVLITDEEKFLLKKLLVHAHDRICSVNKLEENEKNNIKSQTISTLPVEEINRVRNAPLNRLMLAIKHAQITDDTNLKIEDLELKDSEKAIKLAVSKNIEAIKKWKKENANCLTAIKNQAFINSIQSGIQTCNYLRFTEALDKGNEDNLEAILHFINANEKFLNKKAAMAETALSEDKLEESINKAFYGLGKKDLCPVIRTIGNKIFVTGPVSSNESLKKSLKITCSKLNQSDCEKSVEFVADFNGQGTEVRLKQKGSMSLKVETNGNCDKDNVAQLEADKPKEKKCEDKDGKKRELDPKTNECVEVKPTEKKCEDKDGKKQELDPKTNECVEVKPTEKKCEDKDGKKQELDPKTNECVEVKPTDCSKLTPSGNDKTFILDAESGKCVETNKPSDNKETKKSDKENCEEKNDKWKSEGTIEEGVRTDRYTWSDGKCIDKQEKTSSAERSESEMPAPQRTFAPTPAPQMFTPISVPTRSPYILPGMP